MEKREAAEQPSVEKNVGEEGSREGEDQTREQLSPNISPVIHFACFMSLTSLQTNTNRVDVLT